ncbi:PREDICTED: tumor necrosis factor receptor superfamily member 6 [Miniopterus natalensis]|uniref:tumor necrosis factor receptor superfamily member 6 n=1 Tax=Miniopterus natalensis TaxID=291302 RepID=UPI0007A6F0EE|nr:PREDICTED: tumor necrosis factor receptor superfamily member 6 [Miniopterus natalensis]
MDLLLFLEILTFLAGSLTKGGSAQVTNSNSELLKWSKNITKREAGCPEGQQRQGQFCCLPCLPGERKKSDCGVNGDKLVCVSCLEGVEFTDKEHYSYKCRKCGICDGEHGLEVETNCTRTQNIKCRCKSNFFCDTPPCEHCNPCTMCKHGIAEDCTATQDTRLPCLILKMAYFHVKCPMFQSIGSSNNYLWFLVLGLIPIAFIVWFLAVKRRHRNNNVHCESTPENTEMSPLALADIDLDEHMSSIAEQMTFTQVKEFVRKNGISEAKIDEIKNNYLQDTAEQKIQLLRNWYQCHGKKGACVTLITSLKNANLCALAEKISNIVLTNSVNGHENANI